MKHFTWFSTTEKYAKQFRYYSYLKAVLVPHGNSHVLLRSHGNILVHLQNTSLSSGSTRNVNKRYLHRIPDAKQQG